MDESLELTDNGLGGHLPRVILLHLFRESPERVLEASGAPSHDVIRVEGALFRHDFFHFLQLLPIVTPVVLPSVQRVARILPKVVGNHVLFLNQSIASDRHKFLQVLVPLGGREFVPAKVNEEARGREIDLAIHSEALIVSELRVKHVI